MFKLIKNKILAVAASNLAPYLAPKKEESTPLVLEADSIHGQQTIQRGGYAPYSQEGTLSAEEAKAALKLSFQRGPEVFRVQEEGKPSYALDSDSPGLSAPSMFGMDGVANAIVYTFFAKHGFIGWQLCSMLSQHWLINRACRIPNEDAISPGWEAEWQKMAKTKDNGLEPPDKKRAELLRRAVEISNQKFHLSEHALRFGVNRSIYGQALAYFVIEGEDPSIPLNIDGVKPGSFKGISIVEPYWAFPEWAGTDAMTPGSLHFYKPQYYSIGGQRVHISRLCVKPFVEVPDILKPSYYFGGIPLTQMIYERVYAAEKTANEVPELALTKRMLIVDANIADLVARPEAMRERMNVLSYFRSNKGVFFKDKPDTVSQIDTNLSDLDNNVWTQYQLVAAVSSLPADRLLGTSPKGFQSTGEYERRTYAQTLKTYQEVAFRELVEKATALVLKSELNSTEAVSIVFNPIDTPTESEKAQTQMLKAQRDAALITAGVVSPEEARLELSADKGSGYSNLSSESPDMADSDELARLLGGDKEDETPQNGSNAGPLSISAKDEWDESDHPRKDNGEFGNGSDSPQEKKVIYSKPIKEFLGKEFTGVKGQSAVEKLLHEKKGHVKAAFTREDLGDIDLVWGDEEKGLAHLIKNRQKQGIDVEVFLSDFAEVVEKGKAYPNKYYLSRLDIWHKDKMAVLETEYDGSKLKWVVTGFVQKKEPKR